MLQNCHQLEPAVKSGGQALHCSSLSIMVLYCNFFCSCRAFNPASCVAHYATWCTLHHLGQMVSKHSEASAFSKPNCSLVQCKLKALLCTNYNAWNVCGVFS